MAMTVLPVDELKKMIGDEKTSDWIEIAPGADQPLR